MTFTMPAVHNTHAAAPASNARYLAAINAPTGSGVKANGSLPLSNSAGDWERVTTAARAGYNYEFQASQAGWDFTSIEPKVMLWHSQQNAPNRINVDTVANAGFEMRIHSGTGTPTADYESYLLGGNDTPFGASVAGQYPFVIALDLPASDATGGAGLDITDVNSFVYTQEPANITGTSTMWSYEGAMYIIDTHKGGTDTPTFTGAGTEFIDCVTTVQGTDYTNKIGNWVRKKGGAIFIDFGFQIGDGTATCNFIDDGFTIIAPPDNDPANPNTRLTTNTCRVSLNLPSHATNGTAVFTGTWSWGTRAPFDWDQDDLAVVTFTSPTFKGMGDFTVGSSITGPATWDDAYPVIFADTTVDLDGSTFKNQALGYALEMTAGAMDIATMRFETYAAKTAITSIDAVNDVDAVNEEMDLTAHGLATGDQILYDDGGGTTIGGLTDGGMHWVRVIDANTLDMHATRAAALDPTSTAINLTDGVGTSHSFTPQSHAILIDTAGTYNFDNVFFDQSGTNDIETTHASGTVTINVLNGGTVPTVTETGAGAVVVTNDTTTLVNVKDNAAANIENARVFIETAATIASGEVYEATVSSITKIPNGIYLTKGAVEPGRSGTGNVYNAWKGAAGPLTPATVVTSAAHGLETDDRMVIRGAQPDGYNRRGQVTVVNTTTYTYLVPSNVTSPATGTPVVSFVLVQGLTDSSGNISVSRTWDANQTFKGWARKKNLVSPFYKDAAISGTVDKSNGNTINVVLLPDE